MLLPNSEADMRAIQQKPTQGNMSTPVFLTITYMCAGVTSLKARPTVDGSCANETNLVGGGRWTMPVACRRVRFSVCAQAIVRSMRLLNLMFAVA
jgi:hypothetical protein